MNCAAINPGTPVQRIPENVFVKLRAIVTAGLAKDVDDVHQYADEIYSATAAGVVSALRRPESAMTNRSPKLAITSDANRWKPLLLCVES